MLYLIRSFTRQGTYLKVGYTDNLKQRMNQYLVENPGRELVGTRQGNMIDETMMHLYLTAKNLKAEFLEEWFIDCPETLSGFHDSKQKQGRMIWRKREQLFTAFDFSRRSSKVQIYESLRFQHRSDNLNTLSIDKEWKSWNLKKDIENRRKLMEEGFLEFI
jgi:hypothetical protein